MGRTCRHANETDVGATYRVDRFFQGPVRVRRWAPVGLFHLEPHEQVFAFETQSNTSYTVVSASYH